MQAAVISMGGIKAFDTYGAWLLERLTMIAPGAGTCRFSTATTAISGVFEEVRHRRTARAISIRTR
jgi:hypothetical protein